MPEMLRMAQPFTSERAPIGASRDGAKSVRPRGTGRVFRRKGGTIWWIQYYHHGELFRESSGSKKRGVAVDLLRKRLRDLEAGKPAARQLERTTFEDLAKLISDDYAMNERKSWPTAERAIAHLRGAFGHDRAIHITPDRVSEYVVSRLKVAKPATVKKELAALGRMFTLAVRYGKLAYRPMLPPLEVRNTRQGFFEDAALQKVLAGLDDDLRPLIAFLALTGWRRGEALNLQWRQVDFGAGTVRLEPGTTKNDEGRIFPFAALPELDALLRGQRARARALERERGQLVPWVFHRSGAPIRSFYAVWRQACKQAGVPGLLIHDLRRTAVRKLDRAGVPRSWAMKLTGHKTESIYRRYAIVSEGDLAEAVQKLAAHTGR